MSTADELISIWNEIHEYIPPFYARDVCGTYRELRALTEEEWERVKRAVREEGFVATVESHRFGFSFALVVYEPHVPLYPCVPVEHRPVIAVSAWQVPGNDPNGNIGQQKHNVSVERGEPVVFEMFMEIAGTPENVAACKREGIEPPRGRGYYQY